MAYRRARRLARRQYFFLVFLFCRLYFFTSPFQALSGGREHRVPIGDFKLRSQNLHYARGGRKLRRLFLRCNGESLDLSGGGVAKNLLRGGKEEIDVAAKEVS